MPYIGIAPYIIKSLSGVRIFAKLKMVNPIIVPSTIPMPNANLLFPKAEDRWYFEDFSEIIESNGFQKIYAPRPKRNALIYIPIRDCNIMEM